ncbi:3-hexulose-6-phosphate synthase [Fictibacillus gelatini]|uniref:3-hexulose-6-phosphate synthase n=1 Tax=Fictibacillus gelatini TaxID=225985 RepID=UPI00040A99AF|nr:3-hexulose-6-phosphate synthase [Fictibacillus gelatini]
MKIQLALDRMTIDEAIEIARKVEEHIDWVEVGTSLIKEFGMESVRLMKEAFPGKTIVADMKTMDNAVYEFEMCYKAGADVATVMGTAPDVSIEACLQVAAKMKKLVMIDLLNTTDERKVGLAQLDEALLCVHVSKDEQESGQAKRLLDLPESLLQNEQVRIAVAGGLTFETLRGLEARPSVAIIGSAITKATDPIKAAAQLKKYASGKEE